jgi:hypothetical protein
MKYVDLYLMLSDMTLQELQQTVTVYSQDTEEYYPGASFQVSDDTNDVLDTGSRFIVLG